MNIVITCHCPFGCTLQECDEHGYCPHLVGFTNDKTVYEPVEQVKNKDGELVRVRVNGKKAQRIQPGDRLVNPEHSQLVGGVVNMAKAWVSDRVYRPDSAEKKPTTR